MHLPPRGQQDGRGDGHRCRHPQIADHGVFAEGEGKYGGNGGGGREALVCAVLLQAEDRDDRGIGDKANCEQNGAADAPGPAKQLGRGPDRTAQKPGDGKGPKARGPASGGRGAGPPSALKPDQQPDAKRYRELRQELQVLQ